MDGTRRGREAHFPSAIEQAGAQRPMRAGESPPRGVIHNQTGQSPGEDSWVESVSSAHVQLPWC